MVKVSTHACMHVCMCILYTYINMNRNATVVSEGRDPSFINPHFASRYSMGMGNCNCHEPTDWLPPIFCQNRRFPCLISALLWLCFFPFFFRFNQFPIQPSHDCATYMSPTEIPLALAPDLATCEAEFLAQSDCLAAWRGIPSPKENSLGKISKRSTITSCSADMMETKTTDIYIHTHDWY